ncbi:hypothetical protein E4U39_002278 [Claviceps sp. Clav50 group G5]|nr:hypothetical protein E4U39_002278 [Claviceps sp. Clav50 group G5]
MPVPFASVCDLLDECYKLHVAKKPNTRAVIKWFDQHRNCINAQNTDLAALLSTLLPEKRSDRVYCIKTPTLEKLIGKALMLGASRLIELGLYKQSGQGVDLADCVERILTVTPNPLYSEQDSITVEEIDQVLHGIASKIVWSSPCIRAEQGSSTTARGRDGLQDIYRRLSAREAKWFTRLILKEFRPLILESGLIYRCCDSALPLILKIQDDFATAIKTLQSLKSHSPSEYVKDGAPQPSSLCTVKPKLGIKIGRQNWFKGRSIKHCLDLGRGRMSVEEKIDGEYCQFHVSIRDGKLQIQIFSKSGKDSTEDRYKLRGIITKSIGFGRADCTIQHDCILEGELVVHDDVVGSLNLADLHSYDTDTAAPQEDKIMPFHKIRNHIARRGRLINVDLDSPPRSHENLMIVFYDILYLDQQSLLDVCRSERFEILKRTVRCDSGRAELVRRTVVDFNRPTGASELRKAFAKVICAKGEGLVLKPDGPYFDFHNRKQGPAGFCIKLKKEYIGTFGDVGDFAVVGAGYNPSKARLYKIPNLAWTVFYLGCLTNKEEVRRWGAIPEFTVVSAVEIPESLLKTFMVHCHTMCVPLDMSTTTKLHIPTGIEADAPLEFAFQSLTVFDMRCFSFDKPGNVGFWTLRFPTVSKIHFDRDFSDAITFDELQAMAKEARATPDLEDSQENLHWIAQLEGADPRGRAVDAVSQLTETTMPTPSPRISRSPLRPLMRSRSRSPDMTKTKPGCQPCTEKVTASLPTPPESSPPSEPERLSTDTHKPDEKRKRRHVAPSAPATSGSAEARDTGLPCSFFTGATGTKRRKPLQEVDGNVLQSANDPRILFASAMDGMPQSTRATAKSKHEFPQDPPETTISEKKPVEQKFDAVCCIPGSIFPSIEQKSLPAGKANPAKQVPKPCIFAGENCHLSDYTILFAASALAHSDERIALLGEHGAGTTGTVIEMDEWLEATRFGATLGDTKSPQRRVLMLVDTVQRKSETQKVLASLERARKKLPRKTRGWIEVYDWRVLHHLKVMEDDTEKEKYFDGFHDPWRRWYCGIV